MKKLVFMILIFSMMVVGVSAASSGVEIKVDDISYMVHTDNITQKKIISPKVLISFDAPSKWTNTAGKTGDIFYYTVKLSNQSDNPATEQVWRLDDNADEFNTKKIELNNRFNVKTGSLYNVEITAFYKFEEKDANDKIVTHFEAGSSNDTYLATDLNTTYESNARSLNIIIDDLMIDNVTYEITYVEGICDTKSDFVAKGAQTKKFKKGGEGVISFVDEESGRPKLMFTIDNKGADGEAGLVPGQTYSVYAGFRIPDDKIYQNRNQPYIINASTQIKLDLERQGDYLRLLWDIPVSYTYGNSDPSLTELKIMEINPNEPAGSDGKAIVIFKGTNGSIGYYKIKAPKYGRKYKLMVKYKDRDYIYSNIAEYNPEDTFIRPSKPFIPDFLSERTMNDLIENVKDPNLIKKELKDKYLVPDYKEIVGNVKNVMLGSDVFRIEKDKGINFVWGAFKRKNVQADSADYGSEIYDNDVEYDIYVTDKLDMLLLGVKPVKSKIKIGSIENKNAILSSSGKEIIGYNTLLDKYYDSNYVLQDIQPGKIYYIKILPRKFNLIGSPNTVSVYYAYNGDSFTPPAFSKPPFFIRESTTESIKVAFRDHWSEVMGEPKSGSSFNADTELLKEWQSRIYVDMATGRLSDSDGRVFDIYKDSIRNKLETKKFEEVMNEKHPEIDIIKRYIDLGKNENGVINAKYKFVCIPYADVERDIELAKRKDVDYDFETYISELDKNIKSGILPYAYEDIEPELEGEDLVHTQDKLIPNTKYLLVLQVYRTLANGDIVESYVPNVLIGSTLPEDEELNPDPNVPNLYNTAVTDMTADLQFKYNTDFTYKLFYSKSDDKSNLKTIEVEVPESNFKNGSYHKVVVEDLFPNTTYYFWLKAYGKGVESAYSNTCRVITKDAQTPKPPRHLGIASSFDAKKYGFKAGINEDSLVIGWIRDLLDKDKSEDKKEAKITREFSYQIEIAENNKFIGAKVFISPDKAAEGGAIHEKNIISQSGLIPNRYYYVRGKTIMVIKGEDGEIRKESGYTQYFKVLTLPDQNEYDGNIDLEDTILPDEDFETTYDKRKKELKYRFRYDEKGDNLVSERLISKMIANNDKSLVADLASHKKAGDAEKFKVEMPYPVLRAVDKMRVDLEIKTSDATYTLPYGALSSQIAQYKTSGEVPELVIDIENVSPQDFRRDGLNNYGEPKKFRTRLKSAKKTDDVKYFAKDLSASFSKPNRGGGNYTCYLYNKKESSLPTSMDTDKITCKFNETGTIVPFKYAGASGNNYTSPRGHWSDKYRNEISSQFALKLPANYNPEARASKKNVLNAFYGAIDGSGEIDLDKNLGKDERNTLKRAGLLEGSLGEQTITRGEVFKMAVKAYEMKNGVQASGNYVDKAYDYGILADRNKLRASSAVKNGELLAILSRFIKEK